MIQDRFGSRLGSIRRHARVWRRFVVQAAVRETHYRANFVSSIMVGLVQLGMAFIPVLVLFQYAGDVGGWSRAEVLALVGLYQLVSGLLGCLVGRNMMHMPFYLVRGDLDNVLMRPVSAQFYVMFRWVNLSELGNVLTGVVTLTIGLLIADVHPSAAQVVQAVLLMLSGLVLVTCAWAAATFLIFWTQQGLGILMFFQSIMTAGRYPVSFFPLAGRVFFTFVVPLGFASTFPIQALTDGIGWSWVAGGIAMCVAAVLLLRLWWRTGLRTYASASS